MFPYPLWTYNLYVTSASTLCYLFSTVFSWLSQWMNLQTHSTSLTPWALSQDHSTCEILKLAPSKYNLSSSSTLWLSLQNTQVLDISKSGYVSALSYSSYLSYMWFGLHKTHFCFVLASISCSPQNRDHVNVYTLSCCYWAAEHYLQTNYPTF